MSQPLRITFLHCCDRSIADVQMFGLHLPPVWALTLAGHCEGIPGVTFSLVDSRLQSLEVATECEVFLYSALNQDYSALIEGRNFLAKRFPRALHVVGGPITWSYQRAGRLADLDSFDHVFIGDGEENLPAFIRRLQRGESSPSLIEAKARFPLQRAKPMHQGLIRQIQSSYYGAVIEVSRGCPFLCEFCDIRVMPDNNRSHGKEPSLIVEEIEFYARLGVTQIILACDNFIGNTAWAHSVCDAIIEWRERTGLRPGFYTWLSVDVGRHPVLLAKLKASGIDILFIGIESFSQNSLLETSKLQNTTLDLVQAIRSIQSHGIIIVAGLIFGFDTDPDDITDVMLKGIHASGLISGDPSLLTALPGTPLYVRMKLSDRLHEGKIGLGGMKYQTNIRYLRPATEMIREYIKFVRVFNCGPFQFNRLRSFYDCLSPEAIAQAESGATTAGGFGQLLYAVRIILRNRRATWLLLRRTVRLFQSPHRNFYILRAALETRRRRLPWLYFKFWLVNWSNSLLKYGSLSERDFAIQSVSEEFSLDSLVPEGYEHTIFEPIPEHKVKIQRKNTIQQLRRFARERTAERTAARERLP